MAVYDGTWQYILHSITVYGSTWRYIAVHIWIWAGGACRLILVRFWKRCIACSICAYCFKSILLVIACINLFIHDLALPEPPLILFPLADGVTADAASAAPAASPAALAGGAGGRLPRGVMSGDRVCDEAEDVELHDASCVCQFSNWNDKFWINKVEQTSESTTWKKTTSR